MRNTTSLKLLLAATLSLSFISSISASTISAPKKVNASLSYDAENGWWWYKEKYETPDGKTFETKEKMSSKEKMKMEKDKKVVKLLKEQNVKLEKINSRLEYAHPYLTPKYTVNSKTGKKCKTNSSADCFVMPLQPDAQRVPVLGAWLTDPSPTNSKEWLKWQATYFNHVSKVSYGSRLAFLDNGKENYPTMSTNVYGDSVFFGVTDKQKAYKLTKTIKGLKKDLGLLIFVGGTTMYDTSQFAYRDMRYLLKEPWSELDVTIIVPHKNVIGMIKNRIKKENDSQMSEFWDEVDIQVKPKAFQRFNIEVTPTVVALFKTDKKNKDGSDKIIWQKVFTGAISLTTLRNSVIRFLIYNDIIKPKDLTSSDNSAAPQKNLYDQEIVPDSSNIYKDSNFLKMEK